MPDVPTTDLARAISSTFDNRGTELDPDPAALSLAFATAEKARRQWDSFIERSKLDSAPAALEEIREPLRQFLLPVVTALVEGRLFSSQWTAPGPWHGESGQRSP